MKVIYTLSAVALLACSQLNAQNTPGDESLSQPQISVPDQNNVVEDPSGSAPATPPTPPTPGDVQVSPPVTPGTEIAAQQTNSTITISQTFTNDPNSILIIGTVNSEQEKQAVEAALQQSVPGKQIRNHLTVSQQGSITEPAGAETPQADDDDADESEDENELEDDAEDAADDAQEASDQKG